MTRECLPAPLFVKRGDLEEGGIGGNRQSAAALSDGGPTCPGLAQSRSDCELFHLASKYIDITIPFDVVDDIISDYRIVRRLYIEINNTTYEYEPIAITDGEDIEELLSKNGYVFEKRLPPDSSRVYPKKGKTTNQTVINLIDLLITNAKEPMLKRK